MERAANVDEGLPALPADANLETGRADPGGPLCRTIRVRSEIRNLRRDVVASGLADARQAKQRAAKVELQGRIPHIGKCDGGVKRPHQGFERRLWRKQHLRPLLLNEFQVTAELD